MHIESTAIAGLKIIHLDVHGDNRGWFKENWQRLTMGRAGLPDFSPVQHNLSFNAEAGVTRGLHAEPWDKLVSVAHGKSLARGAICAKDQILMARWWSKKLALTRRSLSPAGWLMVSRP